MHTIDEIMIIDSKIKKNNTIYLIIQYVKIQRELYKLAQLFHLLQIHSLHMLKVSI